MPKQRAKGIVAALQRMTMTASMVTAFREGLVTLSIVLEPRTAIPRPGEAWHPP